MNINLEGKTALVTGAGSGIGRAVAIELARQGAFTFVNYRHNEAGAIEALDCKKEEGGSGEIVLADVGQTAQVEKMMQAVEARTQHLDILVNNAGGLVKRAKVSEMSDDLWDEVMAVNVKSTFICCRGAIPLMVGRGWGRIVNMSSQAPPDGRRLGAAPSAAAP